MRISNLINPLTLQFLEWVAMQPRTYLDTMGAWRTSCPKMPVWEDAIDEELVRVENGEGQPTHVATVVLTERGRSLLHDAG